MENGSVEPRSRGRTPALPSARREGSQGYRPVCPEWGPRSLRAAAAWEGQHLLGRRGLAPWASWPELGGEARPGAEVSLLSRPGPAAPGPASPGGRRGYASSLCFPDALPLAGPGGTHVLCSGGSLHVLDDVL